MAPREFAETALAADALENRARALAAEARTGLARALCLPDPERAHVSLIVCPWRVVRGWVELRNEVAGLPEWLGHTRAAVLTRTGDVAYYRGSAVPMHGSGTITVWYVLLAEQEVDDDTR